MNQNTHTIVIAVIYISSQVSWNTRGGSMYVYVFYTRVNAKRCQKSGPKFRNFTARVFPQGVDEVRSCRASYEKINPTSLYWGGGRLIWHANSHLVAVSLATNCVTLYKAWLFSSTPPRVLVCKRYSEAGCELSVRERTICTHILGSCDKVCRAYV